MVALVMSWVYACCAHNAYRLRIRPILVRQCRNSYKPRKVRTCSLCGISKGFSGHGDVLIMPHTTAWGVLFVESGDAPN